jgi:hypothetical protein
MTAKKGNSRQLLADPGWQLTTVKALAAHLGVASAKIIAWIHSGELAARNIATTTTKRPIYRIARADFDKFWNSRAAVPAPIAPARSRRARSSSAVKEFV